MPLKFYEDRDAFKLFLLDCGLLACMTDASADQMLIGDNVFTEFKGAFTEQYVLQQLLALGLKPYYWSNTKTPSEIDFIIQDSQRVIPERSEGRGKRMCAFPGTIHQKTTQG